MNELVAYKPNATHIETTIINGKSAYSSSTVADYEATGFIIIPMDEAISRIDTALDNKMKTLSEITREEFWDALECLPPENWKTVDGLEMFRMSEYYTADITAHYICYKNKYYSANRRDSYTHAQALKDIHSITKEA